MLRKQSFYLSSIGLLKNVFFENDSGIIQIAVLHHPLLDEITLHLPEEVTMMWAEVLHLSMLTDQGHQVVLMFEAQFEQMKETGIFIITQSLSDFDPDILNTGGLFTKLVGCYVDGSLMSLD